jgi:hypothetical protein
MTSPNVAEPEPTDEPDAPAAQRAPAARDAPPAVDRLLPEQSPEDTDAAWGDYRERERDDDRLYRDRPPHWDDF